MEAALQLVPGALALHHSPLFRNLFRAPPSAHCAAVEAALQLVPGVRSASVSLTVQQAEVRYAAPAGGKAFEQSLVDAVEGCGFEATGAAGAGLPNRLAVPAGMRCTLYHCHASTLHTC